MYSGKFLMVFEFGGFNNLVEVITSNGFIICNFAHPATSQVGML